MLFPLLRDGDEFRAIATKVSKICFSEEFHSLYQELEQIYQEDIVVDQKRSAFCDALYTLLMQGEQDENHSDRAC